jgi:RHS repeat-associated protein
MAGYESSGSNPTQPSGGGPALGSYGINDAPAQPAEGTPFVPPAINLPKGGGAIRGIGEKFTANPVTGTGSMSVPIATSPGRSGFGPQLSLSYDSGSGNGPFGFGWTLSLPAITRKTDKGLPQYRDADESDVYVLSGAEDLVPVYRKDTDGSWVAGHPGYEREPETFWVRDPDGRLVVHEDESEGYRVRRYRPRIEGLFARIEQWTDRATGEIHWRSISRDNVTTLYGRTNNSRVFDPADPAPEHATRIFTWLICESYDDKGNAIVYEYAAEDDANVELSQANERNRLRTANRYLKRIRYGNRTSRLIQPDLSQTAWMFQVVLDYDEGHCEDLDPDPTLSEAGQHRFVRAAADSDRAWTVRPDPFSSHRAGFEVRTYRRCHRVLMFHHFPELGDEPCLVRSTAFDYADLDCSHPIGIDAELTHQGSTRFASFICSVTQSGFVRDTTRTVLERNGVKYATYLTKSLPPLELEYSKASISEEVRELDAESVENLPIGLDGTSYQLVDLDSEGVSGILTEQADAWYYKPNLGEGRFGPLQTVAAKPSLAALASGRHQLLDLAGDGQLDLVDFAGPTPGFYERTQDEDWNRFRPFPSLPNLQWDDPNLRFVDLNGDGHADLLITEQDVFTWYPSLAEAGFAPAHKVHQAGDEEHGPRLLLADGTQSIYLADMCGDGLSALVRIRNGEVCYWPNLGYGRFGAKVTMDNAPWFDSPDQFDQSRVRVVDGDGSGASDLIYLGRDGVRLYFNQSGNRWSQARRLSHFPPVNSLASITTADLLGNGTACLVWSSPLPDGARRPLRYIDLMDGIKPHLLIKSVNNLGAETEVHYAPSSRFYLADKRDGRRWVTRLPFPVQVVERVVTHDRISGNRFVTRYAYHHGYFDGIEREFRGFGMVEQWDTEEFATLRAGELPPAHTNIAASSHVPPVLTRTWFHTGVYLGRDHVSDFFGGLINEYYREPGLTAAHAHELLLADTVLPSGLTPKEEREAARALKGSMLRQEVYALDGTEKERHPYTVTEQNLTIRLLQRKAGNRHAVFFTHSRENVSYHYERALAPVIDNQTVDEVTAAANPNLVRVPDPRVAHALTLEADDFGNLTKSVAISYGRRFPDLRLISQSDRDKQTETLITYTENRLTNAIDTTSNYRTPLPCESRTFELTGLTLPDGRRRYLFDDLLVAGTTAEPLDYEQEPSPGSLQKRLIEHIRMIYRRDDLDGALALGQLHPLGLPFESYKLAYSPGLVAKAFGGRVTDTMLEAEARYVHTEADANWWIPSGRVFYSPGVADAPSQELVHARHHFFQPHRYRDPFHTDAVSTETIVIYDQYDLLAQETRHPLGNRLTVGDRDIDPPQSLVRNGQDYRVLQPALIMDPNRNRSTVAFDALGMVVGTAVMGKPEEDPVPGDRLRPMFRRDLTDAEINQLLADPKGSAAATLLDEATTRFVYDLTAYRREPDPLRKSPTLVATLARETHTSDTMPGAGPRLQTSFSYYDGFGREIQKKIPAESGPAPERDAAGKIIVDAEGQPVMTSTDVEPRWVGSGWTVFNNKGRPVRQYEPFFTDTNRFEFDVRIGVSQVVFYDAVDRVVATLHPNHTWEKVAFDPWRQETWDVTDTVLVTDPATDVDVGSLFSRLPDGDYLPTWYSQRQGGALGLLEQAAARNAAIHAETPSLALADSLGRTFLTIAHNRFKYSDMSATDPPTEEFHLTHLIFDIEGNQRGMIDGKDRVIARYDYDMLGNRLHQIGMDTGERWMLNDASGRPLYAWSSRNHCFRTTYDALRRPTDSILREGGGAEILVGRTAYGETQPHPEANNLRGKVVQLFDQAGVATSDDYDFKGNLLRSQRQLAQAYDSTLDWSAAVPLEAEIYVSRTRYDALNRPRELVAPDKSVISLEYNDANLLERVEANLQGSRQNGAPVWTPFIFGIEYDAKGQRTLIDYGNGVRTTYTYDPLTYRLTRLLTRRDAIAFPEDCPDPPPSGWPGCRVQDLRYTYDALGNITHMSDGAQQRIFFRNRRIEPSSEYTYDAVGRLIEATGREHLGQVGGAPVPSSYNDAPRVGIDWSANDGNALGSYRERYVYDAVGNLLSMQHRGTEPAIPGWTRAYTYEEPSLLELTKPGNRLTRTTVGVTTETYSASGNGYDAHGNMLRMPHLKEIHWDFKDQLHMTQRQAVNGADDEGLQRQGERTYYVYNSAGERVRKVTELATGQVKDERIYLDGFEIYRRHGANPLVRETLHIRANRQRIALVETRTEGSEPEVPRQLTRYQLVNHLSSASLELDGNAQIVSYEEFTPYGSTSYQAVRNRLETSKRFRYTGKERDEESGLYYYGARYYAAVIGRWTRSDPIGLVDGTCPYCFARCNPVNLLDATGHQAGPWAPYIKMRRTQEAVNEALGPAVKAVESFGEQIVKGDFYEGETTWAGVAGNVGVGLIPVVGQIADARDTAAAIKKVWDKPTSGWAWGGLGMAVVGWVPLVGDAVKGSAKVGRKVAAEAGQKLEQKLEHKLEKELEHKLEQKLEQQIEHKVEQSAEKAVTKSAAPGLGEQMIKEEKRSGLNVDLAAQEHRHKTDYRKGSGKDVQSAHMVNSSSVSDISDYVRDRALTALLPAKQHKAFDDYWKKWARDRLAAAKPGEELKVTVAEWEKVLNEAAESVPELSGRTAETMSFMIRTELYQTLGLQPDQLIRIPFSK